MHKPSNYHYRAEFYKMKDGLEALDKTVYTNIDESGLRDIRELGKSTEFTRVEVYSVKGAVETFKELF
jgi:hypothetical protein